MPSSTLLHLTIGTLLVGLLPSCGSGDSSVLVTLSGLPPKAKLLAVSATLDQKPLTGTSTQALPLMLPLDQNEFGLTVPPGHLALNLQALDVDQCTQGRATPELDVVAGLNNLAAPLTLQSPRQCGTLAPCTQGTACAIPGLPTGSTLQGMWTISPKDIWAVGSSATVLHYDGTSWTVTPAANLPIPSTTQLNAVWASASNDVWAVGSAGKILHYDGTTWSLSQSGATRDLWSISGVSGQSIWTVGLAASPTTQGEFWHWDGTKWMSINPFGNGNLYAVYAVNPTFILGAGGSSGNGLLWVWDGVSKFKDYSAAAIVTVFGLWASDATHALAVGGAGEILRFDGTSWKLTANSINNDLTAVTSDGTAYYVVGSSGFAARSTDPTLSVLTPITKVPTLGSLWAVQTTSNGLAWFAGDKGYLGYSDSRP